MNDNRSECKEEDLQVPNECETLAVSGFVIITVIR